MPLYEYRCAHCGKRFEVIQKFSDAPLTVHPECGSGPVERLISAPALQFKGSGWYVNDYAKAGAAKPEGAAPAPAAKTEGGSDKPAPAASSTPSTESSSSKTESSSPKSDKTA